MNKPNTNIFVPDMNLLCKAKSVDGEWVVGYLTPEHSPQTDKVWYKIRYQIEKDNNEYTTVQTAFVDEDTICRCLGFKDINGKYVFDNHFVKHYTAGKENKDTYEIGKVFFSEVSLSWNRTVEYIQENGQRVVRSYSPPRKKAIISQHMVPTVQMTPTNDYELLGYAFDRAVEAELLHNKKGD